MHAPDLPHSTSFPWPETKDRLDRLLAEGPLAVAGSGRWYEQRTSDGHLGAALRPPLLLVGDETLPPAEVLRTRCDAGPGRHAALLLQAGAAALGLFDGDEVLDHKAMKRYVVRGKGRAQPTHLKTRGKSRMGSRLRLRNARRLLEEVNERVATWWEDTPPDRIYVACPPRLRADLHRATPPPPWPADDPRWVGVPLDVRVPTHAELLRVRRSLGRGRLWTAAP